MKGTEYKFIYIINNTAPFVSVTWHQKEPLGCVVYWHCPTNDSCNKCIHSCCLPCNYVTKPFRILQRVIKSKRVCISIAHSKSQNIFFCNDPHLFSDLFLFWFQWYTEQVFMFGMYLVPILNLHISIISISIYLSLSLSIYIYI